MGLCSMVSLFRSVSNTHICFSVRSPTFRLYWKLPLYPFVVSAFGRTLLHGMGKSVGSVLDRVQMMGYDKYEWTPLLLEKIPQDQLPEEFGGYKNFTAEAEYS